MSDDEYMLRIFCALMAGFLVGYLCCAMLADGIIRELGYALELERRAAFHAQGDD